MATAQNKKGGKKTVHWLSNSRIDCRVFQRHCQLAPTLEYITQFAKICFDEIVTLYIYIGECIYIYIYTTGRFNSWSKWPSLTWSSLIGLYILGG